MKPKGTTQVLVKHFTLIKDSSDSYFTVFVFHFPTRAVQLPLKLLPILETHLETRADKKNGKDNF